MNFERRPYASKPLNTLDEQMPLASTSLGTLDQQRPTQIVVPIGPIHLALSTERNLPNRDLIEGSREMYIKFCVPLYEASMKGDWKAAISIFNQIPELVRYAITDNSETPLHIAASAQRTTSVLNFVENLVGIMEKEDMQLQNQSGDTALSLAATVGNVETTKIMLDKNKAMLDIPGSKGMMPLYVAALFGRVEMVRYLYDISNGMSGMYWNVENRGLVLQKCVEANIFDVAVKIVKNYPELISSSNKRFLSDVLLLLAEKTDAFIEKQPHIILRMIKSILIGCKVRPAQRESDALQLLTTIWEKIVIMPKNDVDDIMRGPPVKETLPSGVVHKEKKHTHVTYPSRILFVAVKMGNTRFIVELIRSYPNLIRKVNDKGQSIFHMAVKCRQADIYNLLYETGLMKELITPIKDKNGNNMLHLVGKSAKPKRFQSVSGVALQMQRELLWFKEVQQMIPPTYRQRKNNAGEEPHVLFTKKHEKLVEKGEAWMKETAAQCMVVAALITTIVFAAAFTLPGGYDQSTGFPVFRPQAALSVFLIADTIALIFSSTSVLIFLSILTSRYAEHDFLDLLPKKLMYGLVTLFLSIVTMMVTFGVSFSLLYHNKQKWIPIMVIGTAAIPVVVFVILQFHLLRDIINSRYLFKPKKQMLYY